MSDAHWWIVAMIYLMPDSKVARRAFGIIWVVIWLLKQ